MKERNAGAERESSGGRRVAVLEHRGCAGTIGRVVNEDENNFEVKCNDCNKPVIIDLQQEQTSSGRQGPDRVNPGRQS